MKVQQNLRLVRCTEETNEERTRITSCLYCYDSLITWTAQSWIFYCMLLSQPKEAWWNLGESKQRGVRRVFEGQAAGRLWRSLFLLIFRKKKTPICRTVKEKKGKKKKRGKKKITQLSYLSSHILFFSKAIGIRDTCPTSCSSLHQGMCRMAPPFSDFWNAEGRIKPTRTLQFSTSGTNVYQNTWNITIIWTKQTYLKASCASAIMIH